MNSKRSLYQPVAEEKSHNSSKRKTLAQGRLIQSKSANEEVPQSLSHHTSLLFDIDRSGEGTGNTVARENDDSRPILPNSQSNSQSIDPSTPRKARPQTSFTQSPRAVQPSRSLDISDTDSEVVFNFRNNSQNYGLNVISPRNVLVLESSQSSTLPEHSEVPQEVGYQHSPARLEFHSPARLELHSPARLVRNSPGISHDDCRNSGDVAFAAQGRLEHMPRVQILDATQNMHESPAGSGYKPVQVISHSSDAVNIQPHNPALVQLQLHDAARATLEPSVHRYSDTEQEEESSLQPYTEAEPDTSHGKHNATSTSKDGSTPGTRKKKAPRFVASRYMQAKPPSAAGKHGKAGGDKSVLARSGLSSTSMNTTNRKTVNSSTLQPKRTGSSTSAAPLQTKRTGTGSATAPLQPKRTGSSVPLQPKRTGSSAPIQPKRTGSSSASAPLQPKRTGTQAKSSAPLQPKLTGHVEKSIVKSKSSQHVKSAASKTPSEKPRREGGGGKASTPTTDSTKHEPEAVDISAIGPSKLHYHNSFNSPTLDDTAMSTSSKYGARTRTGSSHTSSMAKHSMHPFDMSSAYSHDSAYVSKSKVKEPQTTQLELDMQYARYLQWLFLRSSLTHSQQQQQQHFMSEANALWQETERMREQETQLTRQLAALQHTNNLDHALNTQEAVLNGVCERLGDMKQEYNHLAAALDTTRHQIPTKGVHIPNDEQHFQDRLCEALAETEQLLGELSVMTGARTPNVLHMSQSLHAMHDAAQTQVSQLHRCNELLAAADSLSTRESSLRIQQLQNVTES